MNWRGRQQTVARVSLRGFAAALLLLPLGAALSGGLLPEKAPVPAAFTVLLSTLAVSIVPGTIVLLAVRPNVELTMLQTLGLGTALTFALVQILTMVSLLIHLPATVVALGTFLACFTLVLATFLHRNEPRNILIPPEEFLIAGLLCLVGAALYLKGSPIGADEDLIHIAVIRRLVALDHPALDNIYYSPGLLYTYPFPGIHFFCALISLVGNVDPILVYHKLRFFSGPLAILFVHLAARLVFRGRRLPLAVAVTAILFVINGSFADVPSFSWAQLAPFSHASDLAMNLLLPATIILTLQALEAKARKDSTLFISGALSLVLMLTIVHIREAVQYVVYLAAFLLIALFWKRDRRQSRRTAGLLLATVTIMLLYVLWQQHNVHHVQDVVDQRRHILLQLVGRLHFADLFRTPFRDNYFSIGFETFYYCWFPLVLLVSPAIVYILRDQPHVLAMGMCVFLYLLVVRLPLLSIPYIIVTYYEILYTPVRNVAFFIYLLAGASFYTLAVWLARLRNAFLCVAAGGLALYGLSSFWRLNRRLFLSLVGRSGELWDARFDGLFVPTIAAYIFVFALTLWRRNLDSSIQSISAPSPKYSGVLFLVLVSFAAAISFRPDSSLTLASIGKATLQGALNHTATDLLLRFPCVEGGRVQLPSSLGERYARITIAAPSLLGCAPDENLVSWARRLPATAVFAINTFNRYSPAPFLPQQIDAWPVVSSGSLYWAETFTRYSQFFEITMEKYSTQPFFNSRESWTERMEFVRALSVTHVLVDPMYYQEMRAVLAQWPEMFESIYDDGRWAVYQVSQTTKPGSTTAVTTSRTSRPITDHVAHPPF